MANLEKISHKSNNFGFLRLLFAYLVILSHSPELLDGNSSREFLTSLTGNISFGVLAVDGFFLISGYLICQSFEQSTSLFSYFVKRVLRIYPAFIAIWIISLFVIVPFNGQAHLLSQIDWMNWARNIVKVMVLSQPHVEGFSFTPSIQTLNGSMWTIRYEFLCYLLIPLVALLGLNKRNVVLLIIAFLCINLYTRYSGKDYILQNPFPVSLYLFSRLVLAFLVGMCYYQFRKNLVWSTPILAACFVAVLVCLSSQLLAEIGMVLFGSYLLFYFAFQVKNQRLMLVGSKTDISYGVYLYAWPVQSTLISFNPSINPWLLSLYTIVMVSILGFISWTLIEKPSLSLKSKFTPL